MRIQKLLGWLFAVAMISVAMGEEKSSPSGGPRMSYVENGVIKVGVNLDRGGAIGFLAEVKTGESVVNVHDLGRWIGQSYYSGPQPYGEPHPRWKNWPWNPVSAGDVYGNPSELVEQKNDGQSLYIRSIPKQWALKNVPGECQFETWVKLEGKCVRVRNRLTNRRSDRGVYPARDQELPFVYTIGKLHRLMTYAGEKPFEGEKVVQVPNVNKPGNLPQWSRFDASEHWAAMVDDRGWGLGVIHPGVVEFLGGFYGKPGEGGPEDDATGYLSPIRKEILDQNIVYEFEYTLVLGSVEEIRTEAARLRPKLRFTEAVFEKDRQHWWLVNATDEGFPLKGNWKVMLEQNDPQLIGPEGNWRAEEVPTVYIRAAFQTSQREGQVFWEAAGKPGFPEEQSVRFAIEPGGKFQTYAVKLSESPRYQGTIRRLRIDPVAMGGKGERVEVEFISGRAR